LHNLEIIEEALLGKKPEFQLLLSAKSILDPQLNKQVVDQQVTYQVVKTYGRQLLREEIKSVEKKLFNEPEHRSFKQKILSFFKS
tara:strand:- start:1123 stop:1377 length:255 start_codon:yes stop_codon:yes gene_type:complete